MALSSIFHGNWPSANRNMCGDLVATGLNCRTDVAGL